MKIQRARQSAVGDGRGPSSAALIRKAIQNIESKIDTNEVKATIGDFIRLLQLEKEMEIEQPRDIKVTWVDKNQAESATDE
ncbi:MAG TPA: hypothetical protein VFA33_30215 [Bryobacteraceae bacterium]|nr:hypothetical protein [Bryobacteraceae bacterium]